MWHSSALLPFLAILATVQLSSAKDVIIVGAGISGLAAARRLKDFGGINVKILEARPYRYGGRIHTDWKTFNNETPLDLGSAWIHGAGEDNPLVGLAKNHSITLFSTDTVKGTRWSSANFTPYKDDIFIQTGVEFIDMMFSVSEMSQPWTDDKSLDEAIRLTSFSVMASDPLMQLFTSSVIMAGTGADVDNISAKYLDAGESFEGPETVLPRGMSQILDSIVAGQTGSSKLTVELDKEVRKVAVKGNKVIVKTADGEMHKADSVIVTVPLSILQSNKIDFQPPLSPLRTEAINKLGVGIFNKIFLEFDEVFWDKGQHYFGLAPVNQSEMGLLNTWFNLYVTTQKPILVGFLFGRNAIESESWSDEHAKSTALDVLTGMFGDVVRRKPVKSMTRTKWFSDKYAKGAFSYYPVGATPEDRRAAFEPVEPFIYFAGEHAEIEYFGSLHGAYMSGNSAADRIIESIILKRQKTTQRSNLTKETNKDFPGKLQRHTAASDVMIDSSAPSPYYPVPMYSMLLLLYGYEFLVR